MSALAPATPTTIASGVTTLPAPLAAGHKAGAVPPSWTGLLGAVKELDLVIRGSELIAATVMRLFEWYLTLKTSVSDNVTFTNGTNTVDLVAHGHRTGTGPLYLSTAGGTGPAELLPNTPFFVIDTGANTLKLASTFALAMQETPIAFTDDGTGTTTLAGDDADAEGNGVTQETEAASVGLLGDAADGVIALDAGALGYSTPIKHRNGVVAYSVQGTLDTGNVTIEMSPRGET